MPPMISFITYKSIRHTKIGKNFSLIILEHRDILLKEIILLNILKNIATDFWIACHKNIFAYRSYSNRNTCQAK